MRKQIVEIRNDIFIIIWMFSRTLEYLQHSPFRENFEWRWWEFQAKWFWQFLQCSFPSSEFYGFYLWRNNEQRWGIGTQNISYLQERFLQFYVKFQCFNAFMISYLTWFLTQNFLPLINRVNHDDCLNHRLSSSTEAP